MVRRVGSILAQAGKRASLWSEVQAEERPSTFREGVHGGIIVGPGVETGLLLLVAAGD